MVVKYLHSYRPRLWITNCRHSIWTCSLSVAIALTINSYCTSKRNRATCSSQQQSHSGADPSADTWIVLSLYGLLNCFMRYRGQKQQYLLCSQSISQHGRVGCPVLCSLPAYTPRTLPRSQKDINTHTPFGFFRRVLAVRGWTDNWLTRAG